METQKKLLIVEDDWFIANDTKTIVENLGYEVTGILPSGEEAVKIVEINPPDLILMDIMLKGQINGIDAVKQINTKCNIPIIYVTAFADKDLLDRIKITGPYGYLTKPFKEAELHIAIEIALYKQKMEERFRNAQKMESIGTLTGGIAHDFNNILGIIMGNAELALEDVPKSNPAYSSLEEIMKASSRAANIVKQLLSFNRKTDQKMKPIQIGPVIKDILWFLRSTIPGLIDMKQEILLTNEVIFADATQISRIMMNLCLNASQAMEQSGGELSVAAEKMFLDDRSARDYPDSKSGYYISIIVKDTGPGIEPEIIGRIFDPYFTTRKIGKGSGMGLAVVHGIVKNHCGVITVDSSPGKGAKFSIFFPLTNEKPVVEPQTTRDIPKGSETILFVDDEISNVKMVQKMLSLLGYKVHTATKPQDALERFAKAPDHFDLVITDMTMPGMTGVNLSEKLMEIRPEIPIIICTGYSALVDEKKAKEMGLASYLMKPLKMMETAQTIRKILDNKEYLGK